MLNTEKFLFGDCEVNFLTREIRRDNVLRPVGPKVFDLLRLLIEHRERVVTTEELCERLWHEVVVSDTVVSRTVMKARQAIGDIGVPPQWIKSVYGHGYRFVGERLDTVPARASPVALSAVARPTPDVPAGQRLGLLPVEGARGERQYARERAGLAALVSTALARDERIVVTSSADLVTALKSAPAGLNPERRARHLHQSLGLDHVIQARLRREDKLLRFDYRIFSAGKAINLQGSMLADETVDLGLQLARAIESELFSEQDFSTRFESKDPLAIQAFARGCQAMDCARWTEARNLLRVVLDLEPRSHAARLHYLRALGVLHDPQVFEFGESLLADAQLGGNTRLQAMVHEVLGHRLAYVTHGTNERVEWHRAEALRLVGHHLREDWVSRIYLVHAIAAHLASDLRGARRFYVLAEQACQASGNVMRLAQVLANCALIDIGDGRLLMAREALTKAVRLHRQFGRTDRMAVGLAGLASANAALGFMELSLRQCLEAEQELCPAHGPEVVIGVMEEILPIYADMAAAQHFDRCFAIAARLSESKEPLIQAPLMLAAGMRSALAGDVEKARHALRGAIDLMRSSGFQLYVDKWLPHLLELELRAGAQASAASLIEEIRGHAYSQSDSMLRACLLLAKAYGHHADGDSGAAVDVLRALAAAAPPGRIRARALLDAAWLSVEAMDSRSALKLLRDVSPWLAEHPLGLATDARIKASVGRWSEAARAQQRAIIWLSPAGSAFHAELLQIYRAAARGEIRTPPTIPRLPSLL